MARKKKKGHSHRKGRKAHTRARRKSHARKGLARRYGRFIGGSGGPITVDVVGTLMLDPVQLEEVVCAVAEPAIEMAVEEQLPEAIEEALPAAVQEEVRDTVVDAVAPAVAEAVEEAIPVY